MFTCPTTGKPVSTGIITGQDTLDHLPDLTSIMNCPHCGVPHSWNTNNAWLEGGRTMSRTQSVELQSATDES